MSKNFDITHIGEPLIANLFSNHKEQILKVFPEIKATEVDDFQVIPNAQIIIDLGKERYCVDSKSQIDVALCGKSKCYAIELKLGASLSGTQMRDFFNIKIDKNKKQKRIKGNMLPILRHQSEDFREDFIKEHGNSSFSVKCVIKDQEYSLEAFAIMVRTDKIRDNLKKKIPNIPFFSVNEIFTKDALNKSVCELVENSDYYTDWGLNQCPTQLKTN